jgi:NAD(P)H-dependent FMN reductase
MNKLEIQVILGSTREGRFGDKPARWIHDFLAKDERLDVELLDLRDWQLPLFDQAKPPSMVKDGKYGHPLADKWAAKIAAADGYVIVAAEYNHGYGASLKNAIDWIYQEWTRKPVSFVGYGSVGGARAIEQLRAVAVELQMAPLKAAVHVPGPVYVAVRSEKTPVDPSHFAMLEPAATAMREALVWWGTALREARNKSA